MKVHFLEARVPLSKSFTPTSKEPYPNAFEFKSHEVLVKDLKHFALQIEHHAKLGHCLLKGTLQRPLEWESRAGSTDPHAPTPWICLDIDGLTSVSTIDAFMQAIGLAQVSYILQWSGSYGINDMALRAHVFVLLTAPVAPSALKIFLKQLNLTQFKTDLELTRVDVALRWGLDVTTCQSDKLIFIAPPTCTPPTLDPFVSGKIQTPRIEVVIKANDFFDFGSIPLMSAEQVRVDEETEINRLRRAKNLPERKAVTFKLKEYKGEPYFPNPDQATLTGRKEERGFVYLNLNGGDSWGYYHPSDNPNFIFNFKGEPTYRTSELLPEYWVNLQAAKRNTMASQQQGKLFLAFRDFRTAEYFNGWYDEATEQLTLHTAKSEKQLIDFLMNFGQPVPDAVPIWTVVYDPTKPVLDLNNRVVNVFQPSTYMKRAEAHAKLNQVAMPTPIIDRVLAHVFGAPMVPHFFNWLAFCFQYRMAPQTAWVAHGVQGTGKGVLINKVICPLFGQSNVAQKRMEELEDRFNDYLENSLICSIDEAQISDSGRSNMIMANLKNQITEPKITIRRMRQSAYETDNRIGFIFNSNKPDPVVIERGDRRFNVGEYQAFPFATNDAEISAIENELLAFAYKLQNHKVNIDDVRRARGNDAKKEMQMASRTSADAVADAVLNGDLATLWDALPTIDQSMLDPTTALRLQPYKQLLEDLILTRRDKITREELFVIFNYNVGNVASSPWKLTSYLKHHGINLKDIRLSNTRLAKGLVVKWTTDEEWFEARLAEFKLDKFPPKLAVVASQT